MRISQFVTHERPHLDEITAVWLLKRFGEEKFPGANKAPVIFWEKSSPPDGRSAAQLEQEGTLLVGIGGGRFDEHPSVGANGARGKKRRECAATLVAAELGIADDPALDRLLTAVATTDQELATSMLDLAVLVKLMHARYPNDPERVMAWAIEGLEAKYLEQLEFWTTTKAEFEANATTDEVPGLGGKTLKVVAITSNNEGIQKFARSRRGGYAAVVIQQQSSGNVQIFTNRYYGVTIEDVVQMIRLTEQRTKGSVITTAWQALRAEGKVEGAEQWFYHIEGQMLLNGSLTAPETPPTLITLERIREIVRIGINPTRFEPTRASRCRGGACTSRIDDSCPWYDYGLKRCCELRARQNERSRR